MNKIIISTLISFLSFGLCTQIPTESIKNFQMTDTFAWKIKFSMNVPSAVDSAILLISTSSIPSSSLTNKVYHVGQNVSSTIKVKRKFYSSSGTIEVDVQSLLANTEYHLAIYTFNNNGMGIFYQSEPYKIEFRTKGKSYGDYYKGLDTNKTAFLSSLSSLLINHDANTASYDQFDNKVVREVYEQDTFINDSSKKYVRCSYSDLYSIYDGVFTFPKAKFSREHTLPKNWMNFRGINNNDLVNYPEGADWHNLSLADEQVNSQRSDYVLNVPTAPSSIGKARYFENTSNHSDSKNCFEPQDNYKGDAARCIFYTQICYNGLLNNSWGFTNGLKALAVNQDQNLLKTWARTDTPDNQEIARHECIAYYQKSRNPFIDFPDWIDCIDFNDISLLKTCEGLYVKDTSSDTTTHSSLSMSSKKWDVWYYKYEKNKYVLKLYYDQIADLKFSINDISGRLFQSKTIRINNGENSISMNTFDLPKGTYFIVLETLRHKKTVKLLVD